MRYVTVDCHTDGTFVPETEAEEAEAARLNAPSLLSRIPPRAPELEVACWLVVVASVAFVLAVVFS